MEFFKKKTSFDFLRYGRLCAIASSIVVGATLVSLFTFGLNLGLDFSGGTEVELKVDPSVSAAELRSALTSIGFPNSEIVAVQDDVGHYVIRTKDSPPAASQPAAKAGEAPASMAAKGAGQFIIDGLKQKLGKRAPAEALRMQWVGPKAGQQLREGAIKAALYSMALIAVYIVFRFDLRFAPGGVVALLHDSTIVLGAYALTGREFTLGTVAAILTVIGYSINDTIVIYDRVRENLVRSKGRSLRDVLNQSLNETLSRTLITSSVTMLSILGFFVWGTPVIEDIAFALAVGFISGTYSTVYIAVPVVEWMDRRR